MKKYIKSVLDFENLDQMKVKKFPYNAVGKAQARTFSDLMNGSKTNNPNTKMTEMGLGELDKSGIAELTFKGRALG